MITRLRARHRRAWLVLALLAPAVLAAGLAGRRGELRQGGLDLRVPAGSGWLAGLDLLPDGGGRASAVEVGWSWSRTAAGEVSLVAEPAPDPAACEQLLFWTADAGTLARFDEEVLHARDSGAARLADIPLPADAVLLGPWAPHGVRGFTLPAGLAVRDGWLFTWDPRTARISAVAARGLPGVPP